MEDVLSYVKSRANFSTLMLGIGTVLAGTAAAAIRGNMEILPASICLLFVIFAQLSANFAHHYYAAGRYYAGIDRPHYSNIMNEEVKNRLSVRVLREASFSCGIVALMLGLVIMRMSDEPWLMFVIGLLIIGINWILNCGKKPAFGKPWTIVFTWLLFGPVGVVGTSLLQSQHEAIDPWNFYDAAPSLFLGCAVGFMACNVHLMYGYCMYKVNPQRDARGIAYQWGPRIVVAMFLLNGLMMVGIRTISTFYLWLPDPEVTFAPAFIAFAFNTYIGLRMMFVKVGELQFLNLMTKINFLVFTLLTLIFWYMGGSPDDSIKTLF